MRPDRTRRLVGLVAAAFTLGFVATPTVSAQTDAPAADVDQFGGFRASARGNALQITYDSPNLLPTGSPVIQFSVPEALATLTTGPSGFGRASVLFPGPLIADLGSALAQADVPAAIPPYPVRAEAFFPAGPEDASQGQQGTEMVATTKFADSRARSSYAGLSLDPLAFLGGVSASSQSVIEGDQLVSRTRTELSDFSIAGGLVHIESIVTDLVATSNGDQSATGGDTEVVGATVLGLPVTIDDDGVSFLAPPDDEDEPQNPIGGALDDVLGGLDLGGQVGGALEDLVEPLNELLDQVGGAGDEALQQLFEASGIDIRVIDAVEVKDGPTATRTSAGLSITLNYDGQNTPLLSDLLALVPTSQLPADNLGPIPFSPQAIARLLEKIHTISIIVGPGDVSVTATPAFVVEPTTVTPPASTGGGTSGGGTTGGGGGFSTATPDLPPAPAAQSVQPVPVSSDTGFPFGDAIPGLAVLGLLLGSPFFAAGSSKLADNTLAAATTSCPEGLDRPPSQESGA